MSGNTYSWTSKPSGYSSTLSNPSVKPSATTTYYLTESITATGCSKSDSVTITVNPLPSATVAKSTAICSGDSIHIGGTSVSGNTYSWSSNPSGFTSANSNPNVSPSASSTYYLTETVSATGCKKSDSVMIKVNALPSPSIGKTAALCSGGTGIYTTANNVGDTYTWSATGGKIISGAGTDSINVQWAAGGVGNVQVVEMNTNGCKDSISASVVINALPTPSISGKTSTCNTSTNIYQTANDSGSTYAWKVSGGTIATGAGTDSISVNWGTGTSGTLNVVEINKFGCSDSANAAIVINALPTAKFSAPRECQGNTTQFVDSSSTHTNQTWRFGDGNSSILTAPAYTYNKPGFYTAELVVSNAAGCSDSTSHIIEVDSTPNPHWTSTAFGNNSYNFKADDSSLNVNDYQWNYGDGATGTGFNTSHTYPNDTFYDVTLTVKNSHGCSAATDSTIKVFTGISEAIHNVFDLNIYPNPFNEITTMEYSLGTAAFVRVEVYAADGRAIAILANEKQSAGLHQVKLNTDEYIMPQGIYFMRMVVGKEMITERIIRVK